MSLKQPVPVKNNNLGLSDDKRKALDAAFASIDKQFGKGAVMLLGQRPNQQIDVISSGSILVNAALGVGGFPRGRIIEVYGPEASGKTTLTLHTIAQVQKKGGVCAFIDAEHALDPEYARGLGIDLDSLIISQPDSGEQALDIAETLVRSGAVDLLVIDSVAALVPRAELEGDMGDQHVGLQARLMSQALRKLTPIVHKSKTVIIFINQIRSKIGGMAFASNEVTSGGNALKFYASVRLDIRRIGTLKRGDEAVGNRVRVKVVKNKVAPPFKSVEVDLMFGVGIVRENEIFDSALEQKVIVQTGAWFSFKDEKLGQGRENCIKRLKEDEALFNRIYSEIEQALIMKPGAISDSEDA
jgi:recombination protein RecA